MRAKALTTKPTAVRPSWLILLFLLLPFWLFYAPTQAAEQDSVLEYVNSQSQAGIQMAQDIWGYAELGYLENKSSRRLQKYLQQAGFKVRANIADIPTAFVASYGRGKPVISIMAEFDALPGLSQQAQPTRGASVEGAGGHACGHHLFGTASTVAAVAIAQWLKATGSPGTVKLIGTPAEEGGSGKVYLSRAGVFDKTDVALHWHPGDRNSASPRSTTANKSGRFTFSGIAAHAAAAPERGRSALDGVEAMNYMVNLMREHIPSDARIHYVITKGGDAPNIVPESAQVYYYVRHPQLGQVVSLFDRVVKAAEAGAMGTETEVALEVMHGNYPVLPNDALATRVHKNLGQLNDLTYDDEQQQFAETIRTTLLGSLPPVDVYKSVSAYKFTQSMGSTDVGDVSWTVPTVGFTTASWVAGTPAHSWQAVAAGGMSIGHQGMMLAAKTLAKTATDLLQEPALIEAAQQEFEQRRGADFEYSALLGDRLPPLEYRK